MESLALHGVCLFIKLGRRREDSFFQDLDFRFHYCTLEFGFSQNVPDNIAKMFMFMSRGVRTLIDAKAPWLIKLTILCSDNAVWLLVEIDPGGELRTYGFLMRIFQLLTEILQRLFQPRVLPVYVDELDLAGWAYFYSFRHEITPKC